MKDFHNRVAVVTGAGSGIGFALAERFAKEKMRVVLADIDEGALARADEAIKALGAPTLAVRTDVSKASDLDSLAAQTLKTFGAVHVLCNNAGVSGDFAAIGESSIENWQWVLNVNLWSVIYGLRTFVPIMLRQDEGHIVNTASMAGHMTGPMISPYHASKFAVVAISECLYYELATANAAVKVSVLCPGFVKTRIMESDRVRPQELQLRGQQPVSEAAQMFRHAFDQFVGAGSPPAQVADVVLQAIREERFYIFPHPELLPFVQMRMDAVIAQRNPALQLPPDMESTLKL